MTVSGLHPEDLLDREPDELSASEHALLEAHLAQCVACRLLVAAQDDFALELAEADAVAGRAPAPLDRMLTKALDSELHPEELLEREETGELTAQERTQLDAHLAACSPCRLLRAARLDFEAELDELAAREEAALAERAAEEDGGTDDRDDASAESDEKSREDNVVLLSRSWRGRRRVGMALIAAAAVLMLASVAVAGGGTRVWKALFTSSAEGAAEETREPAPEEAARAPKKARTSAKKVARSAELAAPQADDTGDTSEPAAPEQVAPAPVAPAVPVSNVVVSPAPTACAPVPSPVAPSRGLVGPSVPSARASAPASGPVSGSASALVADLAREAPRAEPPAGVHAAGVLFHSANDARRRGDHAAALALYRDLLSQHPGAPESGPARVAAGRMSLDDGDAAAALPMFDKYLEDGTGALREEAMLGRARALQKLGRADLEREAWQRILSSYPQSVHAAHAEARVKELSSQ